MNAIQAKHLIADIEAVLISAERAHKESNDPAEGWAAWYARYIVENKLPALSTAIDESRITTEDYCSAGCW